MDENNNQVNYGPDPVNNGGVNPNQQPPVYDVNGAAPTGEKNGMCLASMICGIIGLILSCCGCGWLLPIVAVVLGVIGKGKATNDSDKKKAMAGLICGIIGIVISIGYTIFYIIQAINGNLSTTSYYYY